MLLALLFGLRLKLAADAEPVFKNIHALGEIPVQAIEALPYILTVFLLAGFIGKAVAPKALGTPYVKERE